MFIDQKQFERLKMLHQALAKGKKMNRKEIGQLYRNTLGVEVSPRTIYHDLEKLRDDYQAPLINENRKWFYTKAFSLYQIFNPEDLEIAQEMMYLMKQFSEFPTLIGLEDIQLKIRDRIDHPSHFSIIQYEQNLGYRGLNWLPELYECIQNKKTIKVIYQDFEKPKRMYLLSPYLLKEYKNRWHLYGYEHTRNRIYNLALDRILLIEDSQIFYRSRKDQDFDFLDEIIGFTYPYVPETSNFVPKETFVLAFDPHRVHYVRTKPWHGSQKELGFDANLGRFLLEFNLRPNREWLAQILEFGPDVEVIKPYSYRTMIKEILENWVAMYNS